MCEIGVWENSMSECSTSVASMSEDGQCERESEMSKGSMCQGSALKAACAKGNHRRHHRRLRPRCRRAIAAASLSFGRRRRPLRRHSAVAISAYMVHLNVNRSDRFSTICRFQHHLSPNLSVGFREIGFSPIAASIAAPISASISISISALLSVHLSVNLNVDLSANLTFDFTAPSQRPLSTISRSI